MIQIKKRISNEKLIDVKFKMIFLNKSILNKIGCKLKIPI